MLPGCACCRFYHGVGHAPAVAVDQPAFDVTDRGDASRRKDHQLVGRPVADTHDDVGHRPPAVVHLQIADPTYLAIDGEDREVPESTGLDEHDGPPCRLRRALFTLAAMLVSGVGLAVRR